MAKDNQTPILDLRNLGAVEDRPKVLLDSGEYPLLGGDDIGPVTAVRLNRLVDEYSTLQNADESEEVTDEQLLANLRAQVAIICPGIPEADLASMSYDQMLEITLFFKQTDAMNTWATKVLEIVNKYRSPSNGTS